jgi:cell wall-associated NlpC family hydrolase
MIEDYIGKPFVDGGRGPDEYDCWGLVKDIYLREYSTDLPDYHISAFQTGLITDTMGKELKREWVKQDKPEVGNLVTISMDMALPRYIVNHVGIYLGGGRFIHTRKATGALIERVDDFKWNNRIEGYYIYGR